MLILFEILFFSSSQDDSTYIAMPMSKPETNETQDNYQVMPMNPENSIDVVSFEKKFIFFWFFYYWKIV